MSGQVSRRQFLRGLAVAAGGGLLAACAPQVETVVVKETVEVEVEKEVEVVKEVEVEKEVVVKETVEVEVEAPPMEIVELRASHWWGTFMTPSFEAASKALPITVVDEMTPHGEYPQKLLTQLAGGVAPDALLVDAYWFGDFWPSGAVAALDPFVAMEDMTKWGRDAWEENSYQGELFGFSMFYPEQITIWINQEMMDDAGVSVPELGDDDFDSWMWDDLVEFLQALTKTRADGTVEQWGMSTPWSGMGGLGVVMLAQSGGQLFDSPTNYNESEILLTSPEAIESFQLRTDLVTKHEVAMTPDASELLGGGSQAWSAGQHVACTITWGNPQNIVEHPFQYTHILLPYSKQKASVVGGNPWALNKESPHIDEAFDLIWYCTTDDMWLQFRADSFHNPAYDTRNHIDRMPSGINKQLANKVVHRDPVIKSADYPGGGDGVFIPRWLGEKAGMELMRICGTAEQEIVLGQKSVEEALADAKAQIDPLLV